MRNKSRSRLDRLICKNNKRSGASQERKNQKRDNNVTYVSFFSLFMKNVLRARAREKERERECFEDVVGDDLVSIVTVIALFAFGAGELRLSESPSF